MYTYNLVLVDFVLALLEKRAVVVDVPRASRFRLVSCPLERGEIRYGIVNLIRPPSQIE